MKILTLNDIAYKLPPRFMHSHKGDYGRVLLIGGNENMGGAIMMAAKAAVCSGVGLTTVATDKTNHTALHCHLPEAMVIDWADTDLLIAKIKQADVILIGCGLGLNAMSHKLLYMVLENITDGQTLILDGDAITLFAKEPRFPAGITVLATPHQQEWVRLSGLNMTQQTEENNLRAADKLNIHVIVKKYRTELYFIGTEPFQIDVGTPAMATGGMGDTLAGMLTGFIGQFPQHYQQAVCAAVYLHSYIAQQLAETRYVVLPTDIISNIQIEMKKYISAVE